jgi:hypothetical protein
VIVSTKWITFVAISGLKRRFMILVAASPGNTGIMGKSSSGSSFGTSIHGRFFPDQVDGVVGNVVIHTVLIKILFIPIKAPSPHIPRQFENAEGIRRVAADFHSISHIFIRLFRTPSLAMASNFSAMVLSLV